MGWAYGINPSGREVGYSVAGVCDEEGCEAEIDLGLAYACEGMHGDDEYGCEDYFCGEHLFFGGPRQMCRACQNAHESLTASECHPDSLLSCAIHDDWREEHESMGWDECMDENCQFHEDEHAETKGLHDFGSRHIGQKGESTAAEIAEVEYGIKQGENYNPLYPDKPRRDDKAESTTLPIVGPDGC